MKNPHNPNNIEKCPHCGSTDGYVYTYVIKGTQWTEFDGTGVNNTVADCPHRESKKRCVDCNKIIKELK